MNQNFTRYAFSDSSRALQDRYGSRQSYARMEESGDRFLLTEQEVPFIESRDGFYMATVGENGWPYVQFRGGKPGFLRVLDEQTIAFADYRGNRQYVSSGNIQDTGKVAMILMDYPTRQRLKIWAEASFEFAEDVPELVERVHDLDYPAKVERVVTFRIQAYDWNCPQHITPRFSIEEIRENPELIKVLLGAG